MHTACAYAAMKQAVCTEAVQAVMLLLTVQILIAELADCS